jgi:antitoxin (DNA-binding transcriptional repressor) of toxin-antitoxin stability system
MSEAFSIVHFRRRMAECLRRVERGETIVLTRNGRPVAEVRRVATPNLDEPGLRPARRPNAKPKTFHGGGLAAFVIRERRRRAY